MQPELKNPAETVQAPNETISRMVQMADDIKAQKAALKSLAIRALSLLQTNADIKRTVNIVLVLLATRKEQAWSGPERELTQDERDGECLIHVLSTFSEAEIKDIAKQAAILLLKADAATGSAHGK